MTISTLNVKALRELAKAAKVKNWWNLTKADLIVALTPVEVSPKDKVKKASKVKVNFQSGEVTLVELCEELNINPKVARATIRKAYGKGHSYVFNAAQAAAIRSAQSFRGVSL